MDHLTPPILTAVRELRWNLLSGQSLKCSLQAYLNDADDEFARHLRHRWVLFEQGAQPGEMKNAPRQQFSDALWDLIERGTRGEPVLEALQALEGELERTANMDLEDHLGSLPFKALIPLLFLHFPAFAITLLGPWLRELQRHLLVLCLLVFSFSTRALTLDEFATAKIASAKSNESILNVQKTVRDIELSRRACAIELKERRVPYRCFASLRIETTWGLNKKPEITRNRLNQRCIEASFQLRGTDAGDLAVLSELCRRSVLKARAISAYKADDRWRDF